MRKYQHYPLLYAKTAIRPATSRYSTVQSIRYPLQADQHTHMHSQKLYDISSARPPSTFGRYSRQLDWVCDASSGKATSLCPIYAQHSGLEAQARIAAIPLVVSRQEVVEIGQRSCSRASKSSNPTPSIVSSVLHCRHRIEACVICIRL